MPELFDLLFYGNYEVKMGVAMILDEQEFEFTKEDWNRLFISGKIYKLSNVYQNLNEKEKKFIESYVESFTVYSNASSD